MADKTLTLAFSCIGERFYSLLDNLSSLSIPHNVNIIVIIQKPQFDTHNLIDNTSVNVIVLDNIGLSKSRNAAIMYAHSDFIWFLDDDVLLTNNDIEAVLAIINAGNADFYRAQIGCIEWHDKTFKQYKSVKKPSKLNLLQISSIEVIANLTFIKNKQLTFNENIGLGTKYQCNEENNFLIDAWEHGARFTFVDKVFVRHTCIFENRVLANNEIFEIRGATASRFKIVGILLLIRWTLRYLITEKKLSYISALYKGYFRGYSSYK
ncbi:glycosyltransferase [Thalassotalea profundi]|uniref:Glycosyltransferase 2-like domain-containing protein n=1 Tax=Thalassotalea profundi TaxID=2036687 RepID=A0ABQ3IDN2_9GAMM|nr:glycosyltransferase [Thalassotalea profundi]GHE80543.1 hypothetical protein GCM10011501_05580 [Thalassotalea profundi]